ncbi:hypothetical protein BN873_380036 [Candidatus Competibacter denitrificans Run_A_D11]|uniref:Uncharacterized protein n=1 Tax=Candidatus Competibacter denitrificans Run_A_D11 TaxID=1400863 RepID=W6M8S0_9GAMM|nr:hypothetical protein BN873_380036 [Candidatus Competibacter denitrificans Run_A_D11]
MSSRLAAGRNSALVARPPPNVPSAASEHWPWERPPETSPVIAVESPILLSGACHRAHWLADRTSFVKLPSILTKGGAEPTRRAAPDPCS